MSKSTTNHTSIITDTESLDAIVEWGFHMRTTRREMNMLKDAARREGRTVSNFVRYYALERARQLTTTD